MVEEDRVDSFLWKCWNLTLKHKTQVNTDEVRGPSRLGKEDLKRWFIVNIWKWEDGRLKFASAIDYIWTLNSDVPLSDLYSKKSIHISSYNSKARRDVTQPNTSHIPHFAKEEEGISEGLQALYLNSQDSVLSFVSHMGIWQRAELFNALYSYVYTHTQHSYRAWKIMRGKCQVGGIM